MLMVTVIVIFGLIVKRVPRTCHGLSVDDAGVCRVSSAAGSLLDKLGSGISVGILTMGGSASSEVGAFVDGCTTLSSGVGIR